MYGEVEVISPFLTSGIIRDEWSASRPGRLTSGERCVNPLDRRLSGTTAVWRLWRKVCYPRPPPPRNQTQIIGRLACSLITTSTELSQLS
jgi:hypothetical protein